MSENANVSQITSERKEYERTLVKRTSQKGSRNTIAFLILVTLLVLPIFQIIGFHLNYVLHLMLYTFMYIAMASSWNILLE